MFLRKSIASPGFPRFQVWVFLLGSLCFIPYNHDVDNKICWSRWACHRLSVLHPTIYQYLQVGIVYTTYTNNFKIISPISDKIIQLGFGPAWSLFIEYSTFLDPDGLFLLISRHSCNYAKNLHKAGQKPHPAGFHLGNWLPQGKHIKRCGIPMASLWTKYQIVDFPHIYVSLPSGNLT
jgi:hypothetical protein